MIGSDIDLSVILFGIEGFEFKKMYLDMIFLKHKLIFMIVAAELLKTQLVYIIVFGKRLITHGQFRMYGG